MIEKSIKFNATNDGKGLRRIIFPMAVAFAMCACSNAPAQPDSSSSPATVPIDFSPGPDGTTLPAPTKAVGEKWPPEVKAFIEGMIALFGKYERPPLSTQEIEKTLGVKLTSQSFVWSKVDASYRISGSQLLDPFMENALANYNVGSKNKDGNRFHTFKFPVNSKRFCINPYDFAIYTGSRYSPSMPIHGFRPPDRIYPPAYEWGMFRRTSSGSYDGQLGPGIGLITSNDCILLFRASTNTVEGS